MTVTERILTIAVVVLGTVTTRFLPFAMFPEGKKLPDAIVRLGRVLPAAVMGFLVIHMVTYPPSKCNEIEGGQKGERIANQTKQHCTKTICSAVPATKLSTIFRFQRWTATTQAREISSGRP